VAGPAFGELESEAARERKAREAQQAARKAEAERKARETAEWNAKVAEAFEQGLAQGEQRAAAKVRGLVAALDTALGGLAACLTAEAEKHAVELAKRLASEVMCAQVLFDEHVLRAALGEALQRTPAESLLRLRVNPDDLAAARQLCGELAAGHVETCADASVGRGGCVAETNLGQIDSTIERRWEAAAKLLAETPREEHHG